MEYISCREKSFRAHMEKYRRNKHPIIGREHFRVKDFTENTTYYFGSRSSARDAFGQIACYGNNVQILYVN